MAALAETGRGTHVTISEGSVDCPVRRRCSVQEQILHASSPSIGLCPEGMVVRETSYGGAYQRTRDIGPDVGPVIGYESRA